MDMRVDHLGGYLLSVMFGSKVIGLDRFEGFGFIYLSLYLQFMNLSAK